MTKHSWTHARRLAASPNEWLMALYDCQLYPNGLDVAWHHPIPIDTLHWQLYILMIILSQSPNCRRLYGFVVVARAPPGPQREVQSKGSVRRGGVGKRLPVTAGQIPRYHTRLHFKINIYIYV